MDWFLTPLIVVLFLLTIFLLGGLLVLKTIFGSLKKNYHWNTWVLLSLIVANVIICFDIFSMIHKKHSFRLLIFSHLVLDLFLLNMLCSIHIYLLYTFWPTLNVCNWMEILFDKFLWMPKRVNMIWCGILGKNISRLLIKVD